MNVSDAPAVLPGARAPPAVASFLVRRFALSVGNDKKPDGGPVDGQAATGRSPGITRSDLPSTFAAVRRRS